MGKIGLLLSKAWYSLIFIMGFIAHAILTGMRPWIGYGIIAICAAVVYGIGLLGEWMICKDEERKAAKRRKEKNCFATIEKGPSWKRTPNLYNSSIKYHKYMVESREGE